MDPTDDARRASRTRAIAEGIRRALSCADGGRALDVGAGAGNVSLELAEVFDEIVLIDVAPEALDVARAAVVDAGHRARVTTALVDLSDAGCDTVGLGQVDVVYTAMALHHIADLDQLFRTVHGLLRPGGRFFGADLDPDGGAFHAHLPQFDGHHGFDRAALAARLTAAGLTVDSVETVHVDRKAVDGVDRDFPIFLLSATRQPVAAR